LTLIKSTSAIISKGPITGTFTTFNNPFTTGVGFNVVDLVYGKNTVVLKFLSQSPPTPNPTPQPSPVRTIVTVDFGSFAMTPNQKASASLLDPFQFDPKSARLMAFLYNEARFALPNDLEKISPDALSSLYEISFSGANIQKLNLESRLDDVRNGSTGFSSNMRIQGSTVHLEDKAVVDDKFSKNPAVLQASPENRWGVWVTGFGDFVDVDSDGNSKGYNFTSGGVGVGIDYRLTPNLALGVMGNYAHTWTNLHPRGHIGVDTGRGGLYGTYSNSGFYLNAGIYGGYNTYDSSRQGLQGLATGSSDGNEYSAFASGGYDFHFGTLTVGPIASLQYTNVSINGFSENNSLAPMRIHDGSQESLRTDVGLRAIYEWHLGKIVIEPSLKAAWEHEFKYSALPVTANLVDFASRSATFFGPNEGQDSVVLSTGISAQWTTTLSTYLSYEGQFGRDRYDSNAVTGGIRISF
jgi:outer membrane autotransporter protein